MKKEQKGVQRFLSVDPAAEEYAPISPYAYVANMPIRAIDPDGRRIFFVGGAGNDNIGWNYVNRWKSSFERSGISGFQRLNVSHNSSIFGQPIGDMMFSSGFNSSRYRQTVNRLGSEEYKVSSRVVSKAVNDIKSNLSNSPLAEGEQLNLAGYSYGSVVQAHAALDLADGGQFIDNLILIGSPVSSKSDLYSELSNHDNIGNVIRVDIDGDYFSDPQGFDMIMGMLQNFGIDGAHFDLARPGAEADKKIQETTDDLKKKGVN